MAMCYSSSNRLRKECIILRPALEGDTLAHSKEPPGGAGSWKGGAQMRARGFEDEGVEKGNPRKVSQQDVGLGPSSKEQYPQSPRWPARHLVNRFKVI